MRVKGLVSDQARNIEIAGVNDALSLCKKFTTSRGTNGPRVHSTILGR